jgi:hypothetical protein
MFLSLIRLLSVTKPPFSSTGADGDSRKEVKDALEFVERCHQFPGMVSKLTLYVFYYSA